MTEWLELDLTWHTTEHGGRAVPAFLRAAEGKAYKPHLRLAPHGEYLGVAFVEGEPAIALPGSRGIATVALIYVGTGVALTGNESIRPIAADVKARLRRALDAIAKGAGASAAG